MRFGLDIIIIVVLVVLMIMCNKIPFKRARIHLESFGPEKVYMEVLTVLGTDTRMNYDTTFFDLRFNGGVGAAMVVNSNGLIPSSELFGEINHERDLLRLSFPNNHDVDSLNAYASMNFDLVFKNSRFGIFRDYDSGEISWKDTTIREHRYYEGRKRKIDYKSRRFGLTQDAVMSGEAKVLYKDSIGYSVPILRKLPTDGLNGLFMKESIWQLCDVSQAYVGVSLDSKQTVVNGPNSRSIYTSLVNNGNTLQLFLEFGSPVSCSNMYPEPDIRTMTRIEFNDPDKIRLIESAGLFFHVKFLQNENIQTVKLFGITTGIAIFLSLLVEKIIKFISFACGFIAERKKKKDETVPPDSE